MASILNRKYWERKSLIEKRQNQLAAYYIQVFNNNVIDKFISDHIKGESIPRPTQAFLYGELYVLNKPEVYKQYSRIINSKYTSNSAMQQMILRNKADARLNSIVESELGRINKNLIAIAKAKFRYSFINYEDYEGEFKDTDYGVIHETFEVYSLNEMSKNIVCGKTPSTKVESNYGDKMPFITIPDMHNNVFVINTERRLSLEGIKTQPKKTLPANSVCVSCIATAGLCILNI